MAAETFDHSNADLLEGRYQNPVLAQGHAKSAFGEIARMSKQAAPPSVGDVPARREQSFPRHIGKANLEQ